MVQTRKHITGNCVFLLPPTDCGPIMLELIEIAPNIDLERPFLHYA